MTEAQPLYFIGLAPPTFMAVDRMREDAQKREQMKNKNNDLLSRQTGPKYGGR